ncbi:MAG: hypothetical protein ABIV94_01925 [Acidimicrobiales bacterium]
MSASRPDRDAERLARHQHGAFNHVQARRLGFTDRMIHRRLATGSWLRVAPAVYVLPSHPGTFLRQCWAAVLAEPKAAVGGLAAAAVLGLEGVRPGPVELVVPPGSNHRNPLARLHRYAGPQLMRLDGLPITTIPQTVLDIAGRLSHEGMERVIDAAVLGRRVTLEALEQRAARYEGTRRPGLPLVRALLADRSAEGWAPPESELERVMAKVLRPLGLEVRWQHELGWRDELPGRRDALLPQISTIVEGDGRRWHARFHDFDRDRWRDNVVVAHGYRPIRLTWVHLTQRPDEVRGLIRSLGRLAA